jgi:hypothetical protein
MKPITALIYAGFGAAEFISVYKLDMARCYQGSTPPPPRYEIESSSKHPPENTTYSSLMNAYSRKFMSMPERYDDAPLEGCNKGDYTGGWRVCLTLYGDNVHNDEGKYQRCEKDDTFVTTRTCRDLPPFNSPL